MQELITRTVACLLCDLQVHKQFTPKVVTPCLRHKRAKSAYRQLHSHYSTTPHSVHAAVKYTHSICCYIYLRLDVLLRESTACFPNSSIHPKQQQLSKFVQLIVWCAYNLEEFVRHFMIIGVAQVCVFFKVYNFYIYKSLFRHSLGVLIYSILLSCSQYFCVKLGTVQYRTLQSCIEPDSPFILLLYMMFYHQVKSNFLIINF